MKVKFWWIFGVCAVLFCTAAAAHAQTGASPADALRQQVMDMKIESNALLAEDAASAKKKQAQPADDYEGRRSGKRKAQKTAKQQEAAGKEKDAEDGDAKEKLKEVEKQEAKEKLEESIEVATRAEQKINGADAEAYSRIINETRRAKILSLQASDVFAEALSYADCLTEYDCTNRPDVLVRTEVSVAKALRLLTTARTAANQLPLPIEQLVESPLATTPEEARQAKKPAITAATAKKKMAPKKSRDADDEDEDEGDDAEAKATPKPITPADFRWSILMKGQVDDMTYQRSTEVAPEIDKAVAASNAVWTAVRPLTAIKPDALERDKRFELLQLLTAARDAAENAAQAANYAEYPARCLGPSALTECDTAFGFNLALGLMQASDFKDPFPRVGFNLRSLLFTFAEDPTEADAEEKGRILRRLGDFVVRPHLIVDVALSSRSVDEKKDTSDTDNDSNGNDGDGDSDGRGGGMTMEDDEFKLKDERTWEGHGGLLIDFLDFYGGTGRATSKLSLVGQLGAISPETDNDEVNDLLQHHLVGIRFTWRGTSPPFLENNVFLNRTNVNGAFIDVGWGYSEQFKDKEARRMRIRSFLPVELQQGAQGFIALNVDSDFGSGSDEVAVLFGINVEVQKLLNAAGIVLPTP